MCLLITTPHAALIDDDHLNNASIANPDGFGWALATGGQLITARGLDYDEVRALWHAAVTRWPESPALWHLRYATHGTTTADNCHPFTPTPGVAIAHNGVIRPEHVRPRNGWSDTREVVEGILPARLHKAGDIHRRPARQYLAKLTAGGANKFAALTADGRLTIVGREYGIDLDGGVWHSNASGITPPAPYRYRTTATDEDQALADIAEHYDLDLNDADDREFAQWALAGEHCPACGAEWHRCACYLTSPDTLGEVER